MANAKMFQSTHPRGVRLLLDNLKNVTIASFNPRTRAGCDTLGINTSLNNALFQSTHPRGVRLRAPVEVC